MCQSKTKPTGRVIAATVAGAALGAMLGGCSDLYMDRRDPIHLSAGDGIAANVAMQTNDPWPAHSGNTNLAFNGQKMQTAVERYRTNTPWVPATPIIVTTQPTATATPNTQQSTAVPPGGGSTIPTIAQGTTTTTTVVPDTTPGTTTQSVTTPNMH
jgi:hypothetical protein